MTTLSHPLRLDASGRFATTVSRNQTDQSRLALAIGTMLGERVMRPDVGSDLIKLFYVVDPRPGAGRGSAIQAAISASIAEVFNRHFPHMALKEIHYRKKSGDPVLNVAVLWAYKDQSSGSEIYHAVVDMSGAEKKLESLT